MHQTNENVHDAPNYNRKTLRPGLRVRFHGYILHRLDQDTWLIRSPLNDATLGHATIVATPDGDWQPTFSYDTASYTKPLFYELMDCWQAPKLSAEDKQSTKIEDVPALDEGTDMETPMNELQTNDDLSTGTITHEDTSSPENGAQSVVEKKPRKPRKDKGVKKVRRTAQSIIPMTISLEQQGATLVMHGTNDELGVGLTVPLFVDADVMVELGAIEFALVRYMEDLKARMEDRITAERKLILERALHTSDL